MMNYSLDVVNNLLASIRNGDEPDFFVNCIEDKNYTSNPHTGIVDSNSGMISMHDFPLNMDIKKAPRFFYLKYMKRFHNLDNMLAKAKDVLFLTHRQIYLEEMKTFVNQVRQLYDFRHLYFMNMYDTYDVGKESFKKIEDKDTTYLIYKFNDEHKNGRNKRTNPDFWLGNVDYWDKILKKVSLNKKFVTFYKIKKFIFNVSNDLYSRNLRVIFNILGIKIKL